MSKGIIIIGLGPGRIEQLTVETAQVLEQASELYLRTNVHPTVADLPAHLALHSFDEIYETYESFAQVYKHIAEEIVGLGQRPEGVVYAVPGHPLIGETTVPLITHKAKEIGIPCRVLPAMSFIEPLTISLNIDPFDGLQIADATLLSQHYHPNLDPDVAVLVVQVYNRNIASEAKMTLMNLYPDEQPIRVITSAGTPNEKIQEIPLYELDRLSNLDHLTSAYIPPMPQRSSLASYQDIVAQLRSPNGCPWDREQTHESLRPYLLEEAYEVLQTMDEDDMPHLQEELGDLLLQVFLNAQIATEDADFKMVDVTRDIIAKLTRRHPHVFGEATVDDSGDVLRNWEEIKKQERAEEKPRSMLDSIPDALPALTRALKVQERAARVGFDWDEIGPVRAKIDEELREMDETPDAINREHELGDLLFSIVNVARWYEIDPEAALRGSVRRFANRFGHIETAADSNGTSLVDMTFEEMDVLWEEAKKKERKG